MTDKTGISQHGFFTVPNYAHGFTTDDNTRALVVSILLSDREKSESTVLTSRYLTFLRYSMNWIKKKVKSANLKVSKFN